MYNEGISYEGDLVNLGIKYEIIKKSGASLSYGSVRLGQGMENAKAFLREHHDVEKELLKEIKEKAKVI